MDEERSTIRIGKCPICKIHVETDIEPFACSEHRRDVEKGKHARRHAQEEKAREATDG